MPKRVKVTGDLYHGVVPEGAIYVGRQAPGLPASKYANPYSVKKYGRDEALRLYELHVLPTLIEDARRELCGFDLACWCDLDQPCHADLLLRVANS